MRYRIATACTSQKINRNKKTTNKKLWLERACDVHCKKQRSKKIKSLKKTFKKKSQAQACMRPRTATACA